MESDSAFTLEKMELNKRLQAVELQVARLVSHIESEAGTFERIEKRQTEITDRLFLIIDRHTKALYGNGEVGILRKIDRLEVAEDGRKWLFRAFWGAIVIATGSSLVDIVLHLRHG